MPFVYFAFQPGGKRAGAGSSHNPIFSRRKYWITGSPEYDTRIPGHIAAHDIISLYFKPKYYDWVLEMRRLPEVPKALNGVFYTTPNLPKNCTQTSRY